MKVLDLFSGIGGFSLGLERAGMETVAFCEYDEKARLVLNKHWPNVPMYNDVRTLTGEQLEKDGITDIGLICGGYPCQPFSVAGKRQGQADDRHLWPEFFRLIQEIRPTWVIAENVAGHINMGLDSVLADLESEGYNVQTFLIPACAVGAVHRRDRVWIVAHSNAKCGASAKQKRQHEGAEDSSGSGANGLDAGTNVAHSELTGSRGDNGGTDRGRSETESEAVQQENGEAYAGDVGEGRGSLAHTKCSPIDQRPESTEKRGRSREAEQVGMGSSRTGEDVAHSDSVNWSPNEGKPNAKADGRDKSSGGGKFVADTQRGVVQTQLPRQEPTVLREKASGRETGRLGSRDVPIGKEWAVESNLGKLADGIPAGLERGRLNADERWLQVSRQKDAGGILRELRDYRDTLRPSQGQGLDEQRSIEYSDALQFLSYILASCGGGDHAEDREAALYGLWKSLVQVKSEAMQYAPNQVEAIWESITDAQADWIIVAVVHGCFWSEPPEVPRVASGVPRRVDRLKQLGNAVVPQVVEVIGRAIMEAEQERGCST